MKTFILAPLAAIVLIAVTPVLIFILLIGALVFTGIDAIREHR